jgi:hypothetical protein
MARYKKFTLATLMVCLSVLYACDSSPTWEEELNEGAIDKIIFSEITRDSSVTIEVDNTASIEALKNWLLESTLPKYQLATQVDTCCRMELHYKNTIKILKVGGLEEDPVPIIYKKHYRFAGKYPSISEFIEYLGSPISRLQSIARKTIWRLAP